MIDDHLCHLFLSLRLNRSSISLASCLVNYGRGFMFDWKQRVCLFLKFRSPNRLYQNPSPQNDWIDKINLVEVEDDCVSSPDVGIRISQLAISEKEFPQVKYQMQILHKFKCKMPVLAQSPHWAALPWIPLGISVSEQVPGWFKCYSW